MLGQGTPAPSLYWTIIDPLFEEKRRPAGRGATRVW
jgi:hypothetical protein